MTPLAAALRYSELGLPVFPVAPVDQTSGLCGCKDGPGCEAVGKHPLVKWADKATTTRKQVTSWWAWKPNANIGIPTGERSGLVVVDIDRQHGGPATRKSLEDAGLVFPPTLAARTRNGGWHFVYQAPAGRRVANTTAALCGVGETPGIDVRGDGGYIIVAPSLRPIDPDPATGALRFGRYSWVSGDHPMAPAPSWVVTPKEAPKPAPAPTRAPVGERIGRDPHKRAAAALTAEVRRVLDSRAEGRNNCLFQAAANLFEIVNTGYLDEHLVRSELTVAALSVGLGEREIVQTLDAQWRRKQGSARPGWGPSPISPNQDSLRLRRSTTMLDSGFPGRSGGGFGR
ncbi:MAG: bifunctional DNA primase/polymerase [Actinomycetota bacterium]|nr:bifunctional DNA primase/polymerase [Actinomycetota bacterium]